MCSDIEPSLQLGANSQSQTYRNEEEGGSGEKYPSQLLDFIFLCGILRQTSPYFILLDLDNLACNS